jgi:hypothetical protein
LNSMSLSWFRVGNPLWVNQRKETNQGRHEYDFRN